MRRSSFVVLRRHEASTIQFDRPIDDEAVGRAEFDKIARALEAEWSVRRALAAVRSDLPSNDWLRRAAYDLLYIIIDEGLQGLFEDRIRRHGRYPRGQRASLNPFQLGLMALFAHDQNGMNARTRERLGKELWHAYRHYVPVDFLLGFLKQARSPDLARRAVEGTIEPDFVDWVVEQRSTDQVQSNVRGSYPPSLEEAVERQSNEREESKAGWNSYQKTGPADPGRDDDSAWD